jgi:hypothetical protein
VPTRWGLQLLVDLVEAKQLDVPAALGIATEIQANNPYHINSAILAKFEQRLRSVGR